MADNFFTASQESANFFTPPQKEADSTVDQKVIGDTALAAAIEALHTKGATHQELIDNLGRADAELRGTGQVFRYSQAVQKVRADTIEKRRKRVEDIIFSDLPADKKKEALLTEQGTSEEDRKEIIELALKKGIKVYQAKKVPFKFEITKEEIK